MMEREPPVKEGEEFKLKCDKFGEKNDGICWVDGFIIFVKGMHPGEERWVKINKVLPRFAFGEVIPDPQADESLEEE